MCQSSFGKRKHGIINSKDTTPRKKKCRSPPSHRRHSLCSEEKTGPSKNRGLLGEFLCILMEKQDQANKHFVSSFFLSSFCWQKLHFVSNIHYISLWNQKNPMFNVKDCTWFFQNLFFKYQVYIVIQVCTVPFGIQSNIFGFFDNFKGSIVNIFDPARA